MVIYVLKANNIVKPCFVECEVMCSTPIEV